MADYIPHITREGERWDLISQRYYGTPYAYERIIAANPTVPIVPQLPAGLRLAIPLVVESNELAQAELPPWKRDAGT